jgi:hypothetical protein
MQDRCAEAADLPPLLRDTRNLHPREAVRVMTGAVMTACHGKPADDATVLCLDWHDNQPATAYGSRGAVVEDR